jgi:hypothetical protein
MVLKFAKPAKKLKVAKGQTQGLRANKVNLRGNQPNSKFKYLTPPSASFPGNDPDARLARGDDDDDSGSSSSGGSEPAGNGQFDKIVNRYNKKKKASVKFTPERAATYKRRMGSRSAPAPEMRTVPAPDDISDSEDDGGSTASFESDSDGSSISGASFSDDSMSLSGMSSVGRDIPDDDASSIFSGRPAKKKGGGMFGGLSTKDSEEAEKADLMARFHFLKQRGTHFAKNYTAKSSLNEMRMEMGRIEHEAQVGRAIKINRRFLLAGVSAVENVSNNYGPKMVRGKLYRVSHFVNDSIKDYDSAFERMSEEYGGVVGAITGGNPLYEIGFTALYQMFTYAMFYRGAESAKANEELTIEDIKKRFPDLVKEAGQQYAREQQQQHQSPPPQQYQQQYQQQQQQQYYPAQPHATPVTAGQAYPLAPPMAPPSDGLLQAYMQHQAEAAPTGGIARHMNTEDPNVLAHLQSKPMQQPTFQQRQPITQASQPDRPPPVAPPNLMIAEMHQPLPRVDLDELPGFGGDEFTQAVATRNGRPPKINEVPKFSDKQDDQLRPEEVPLPLDEFDDDHGEGDVVIDIN